MQPKPDSDTPEAPASLKPTARRLLGYAKRHKLRLGGAMACLLIGSAIEAQIPRLFSQLVDGGFKPDSSFPLWIVPVVVVLLFAGRGLATFCGSYLLSDGGSRIVLDLRRDMMQSLLRAEATLFSRVTPGIAVNRVVADPQHSIGTLVGSLNTILRDGSQFIFLMGYLFYLNWQLTLLALVVLPLLILVVRQLHGRLGNVGSREYESQQRLVNVVDDVARAWRVIRTFDATDFEKQRFENEAGTLRRLIVKRNATSALMTPATQVVAALGVALILTLALWQARNGQASVGEFVGFIAALLLTISPMRHLTDVSQPILHSLITVRATFEMVDTPAEADPGQRQLQVNQGSVDVQDLTVRYPGASDVALDGLSLSIQPGQTVAFVGASGAGKSTLVSVLLGLVRPDGGQVLLDGQDIAEVQLRSLRSNFAVVSQDIVLFDGSIADNVAYAKPRDDARVMAALAAANLAEYVERQPEGLNASIGVNGSRLSGGQRQRLAMARAFYRDCAIWVFDEATSALDAESEQVVQRSIESLAGTKTVVLIAHRLSTVRRADQIFVLNQGRLVEQGTHRELVERNGAYAAMVRAQDLGDDGAGSPAERPGGHAAAEAQA
jgi:subfamily B ATP-binding cassette protein MsbA